MGEAGNAGAGRAKSDVLSELQQAIGAIEATSADLVRKNVNQNDEVDDAKPPAREPEKRGKPQPISYPGMPEGTDWLQHVPARYKDGQRGFDRRIMEELAAVGVPCYTLDELANRVSTIPQGIPIFIDWLAHLEERIPGEETPHRQAIRAGLIRNLNDAAARGNTAAIETLTRQLRRRPPLDRGLVDYAERALARIATKRDFALVAELIRELSPHYPVGPLIEYLGKVNSAEARELALRYLDTPSTYFAIRALTRMKAPNVRHLIEPYTEHTSSSIRKEARRAMERLPE